MASTRQEKNVAKEEKQVNVACEGEEEEFRKALTRLIMFSGVADMSAHVAVSSAKASLTVSTIDQNSRHQNELLLHRISPR